MAEKDKLKSVTVTCPMEIEMIGTIGGAILCGILLIFDPLSALSIILLIFFTFEIIRLLITIVEKISSI